MDEDDIEEHLDLFPEELVNEELLGLDLGCVHEEEAREKETVGGEEEPPRKITVKSVAEAFADLNKLL